MFELIAAAWAAPQSPLCRPRHCPPRYPSAAALAAECPWPCQIAALADTSFGTDITGLRNCLMRREGDVRDVFAVAEMISARRPPDGILEAVYIFIIRWLEVSSSTELLDTETWRRSRSKDHTVDVDRSIDRYRAPRCEPNAFYADALVLRPRATSRVKYT